MEARARLGVIGGSGLYRFLDDGDEVGFDTPWGRPSGPIAIGKVGDRTVAFLPRHGPKHEFPPHRINNPANLWALREVGVQRVFAPCASGSLRPDIAPGDFVVCDQMVDRTFGRASTFFDGPGAVHVTFSDPYCPELRRAAIAAASEEDITVHDDGTVVVISGPRFSTRAESRWFTAMGWDVVNMTQYPEAVLARELGMCYSAIALVTDWDAGLEGHPEVRPVTQEEVFGFLEANAERVRSLLFRALVAVNESRHACDCAAGPQGMEPILPRS